MKEILALVALCAASWGVVAAICSLRPLYERVASRHVMVCCTVIAVCVMALAWWPQ